MHVRELGAGMGDRALLRRLHTLMRAVCPDPGRLIPLPQLEESLPGRARRTDADDVRHVLVALDAGRLVGGSVSSYLAVPGAGLVETLAVDERRRTPGLPRVLLVRTERVLDADARRAGRELDWLCAHVEPRVPDGPGGVPRPATWERWGFRLLDLPPAAGSPGGSRLAVRGLSARHAGSVPGGDVLTLLGARAAAGTPRVPPAAGPVAAGSAPDGRSP